MHCSINERDLLGSSSTKRPEQDLSELGSIIFTKSEIEPVKHPHNNPMVIQLRVDADSKAEDYLVTRGRRYTSVVGKL